MRCVGSWLLKLAAMPIVSSVWGAAATSMAVLTVGNARDQGRLSCPSGPVRRIGCKGTLKQWA